MLRYWDTGWDISGLLKTMKTHNGDLFETECMGILVIKKACSAVLHLGQDNVLALEQVHTGLEHVEIWSASLK